MNSNHLLTKNGGIFVLEISKVTQQQVSVKSTFALKLKVRNFAFILTKHTLEKGLLGWDQFTKVGRIIWSNFFNGRWSLFNCYKRHKRH